MLPIKRKGDGCVKKDPVIMGVLSLEKFDKHELVLASLPPSNAYLFSCFFALILLIAPYRRWIEEALFL